MICAVKWCVCLPQQDAVYCVAHQKDKDLHPALPWLTPDEPLSKREQDDQCECGGTRECIECDGDGTHTCEHSGCYDEHDCGACDGTGVCPTCEDDVWGQPTSFEECYLRWAAEPAPEPWKMTNPWDEATA